MNEIGDKDRRTRRTFSWKLHGSVALLGTFLVAIMNFGYYLGHNMVNRDRLLMTEVLKIEFEATMGHLRLEETLRRELGADNLQARQHFQAVEKSIIDLLNGCDPASTILFASIGPDCYEREIKKIRDTEVALPNGKN